MIRLIPFDYFEIPTELNSKQVRERLMLVLSDFDSDVGKWGCRFLYSMLYNGIRRIFDCSYSVLGRSKTYERSFGENLKYKFLIIKCFT